MTDHTPPPRPVTIEVVREVDQSHSGYGMWVEAHVAMGEAVTLSFDEWKERERNIAALETWPVDGDGLPATPGPDDDATVHLRCPHCAAHDTIQEIAIAEQWNTMTLDIHDDGGWLIDVSTHDGDFHFVRFECENCGGHVEMPEPLRKTMSYA